MDLAPKDIERAQSCVDRFDALVSEAQGCMAEIAEIFRDAADRIDAARKEREAAAAADFEPDEDRQTLEPYDAPRGTGSRL